MAPCARAVLSQLVDRRCMATDHAGARNPQRRPLAPERRSVYPTLQQLEDEQLVSVEEIDGRRTFS